MRAGIKRRLKSIISLAVSAAFLWLLARGVDLPALARALAEPSIPMLALALGFLAVAYTVRIIRWWLMLRNFEPNLPIGACVWPYLTSIAVNNVMPFRAGDALRVFGFREQLRSPAARVLGTLIIERTLDLFVILGFFFLGLSGLPYQAFPESLVAAAMGLAGFCIAAILALIFLTPWLDHLLPRIAASQFFADRNWTEAIVSHGAHLVEALSLMRSPTRLFVLLGLSLLAWACEGAVFAIIAAAVHAAVLPLGPWFSLATGTLATLIPSSPGYLGTFDYFVARGLTAYGAASEVSVAFALAVHAVLWVPLTAMGLLYLVLHGTRFWTIKPNPRAS